MGKRVLYYQCFAGVSGDMHLAALIGLGVPTSHLRTELSRLGIDKEFELRISEAEKSGINGIRVDVEVTPLDHDHSHGRQRNYRDIKQLINKSGLDSGAKKRALEIFEELARAEAIIHNTPLDEVHFHEVGATDSIVDIVGAAIGLEYLAVHAGVDEIRCSSIELGSGSVTCAHGTYPVPAPATAEILQDIPVTSGAIRGEATTPTGAAILKASVNVFEDGLQGRILKTTYGIGHRDTNVPNVLRCHLLEETKQAQAPTHIKLEANIDDMSPEAYAPLFQRLFDAGAHDVFLQNIVMKKSRPAQVLSILCSADIAEELGNVVLNNSTTIGLRLFPFEKIKLPREIIQVPTSMGPVDVKMVTQPDGNSRWKSEHDQVAQIAEDSGEPFLLLKERLDQEIATYLKDRGDP